MSGAGATFSPRALRVALGVTLSAVLLSACSGRGLEALPDGVTFRIRGHQDVVVFDDGSLRPRWFGPDQAIGVCLDAPLAIDTSQWQVRLRFAGVPAAQGFIAEPLRAGTTQCYRQPPPADLATSVDLEVCATLRDGFDNRLYRLPCFRAAYEADGTAFRAELEAIHELILASSRLPRGERLAANDRKADELTAKGYLLLGANHRLVNVHELIAAGTPEALAEARRRLADPPAWAKQPEAAVHDAKATLELAKLELAEGRPRRAWQLLAEADELARSVVVVERPGVAIQQARILARLGAGREAIDRLQAALDDCRQPGACHPYLVAVLRQQLGWLLLLDPDAGPPDLEVAEASFRDLATAADIGRDRERANQLINSAFLASHREEDPRPTLDQARAILATLERTARSLSLAAWSEVIEGLWTLAAGDPDDAIEHCTAAARGASPVAAWGWSCIGRAHRLRGDREAAAAAFDQAVLHHALAAPDADLNRPLAPGPRVDDTYRAARLAVEAGDLDGAWRLLEALDQAAIDAFGACEAEGSETSRRLEQRRRAVLSQLAWTEPPLAPQRREQVAPVRRSLLRALGELQRELLAVCRRPLRPAPAAADLRAFALSDEVVALWRLPDGGLAARRTRLARSELRQRLEELAAAQRRGRLGDEAWRALAQPIAESLLPPHAEGLGEVTRFALHGLLQRVPLAGLPIATAEGQRWLAEVTTAVVRPGLVETPELPPAGAEAVPLFVVDPRRDLPSGRASREAYRRRFPAARILFGTAASVQAVRSALPSAAFLHIDAHGLYDEAFPELSRLQLADGSLTLADFANLAGPLRFANLSGCHTGRAAPTGDSGRYGLAGALARRGAGWVIAHRSATLDSLGRDFNRVFYRQIRGGSAVVEAYRAALADLRRRYPAAAWSNLTLLGAGEAGQNGSVGD